jgi:hypothetical protein
MLQSEPATAYVLKMYPLLRDVHRLRDPGPRGRRRRIEIFALRPTTDAGSIPNWHASKPPSPILPGRSPARVCGKASEPRKPPAAPAVSRARSRNWPPPTGRCRSGHQPRRRPAEPQHQAPACPLCVNRNDRGPARLGHHRHPLFLHGPRGGHLPRHRRGRPADKACPGPSRRDDQRLQPAIPATPIPGRHLPAAPGAERPGTRPLPLPRPPACRRHGAGGRRRTARGEEGIPAPAAGRGRTRGPRRSAGPENRRNRTAGRQLQSAVEQLGLTGHVRLLGPQTQDQVHELLDSCDVFVAPCVVGRTATLTGCPPSCWRPWPPARHAFPLP